MGGRGSSSMSSRINDGATEEWWKEIDPYRPTGELRDVQNKPRPNTAYGRALDEWVPASTAIRAAFRGDEVDTRGKKVSDESKKNMRAIEDAISNGPGVSETIYRGVSLSEAAAAELKAGAKIDMGGPSSWSKSIRTAEDFANMGYGGRKGV